MLPDGTRPLIDYQPSPGAQKSAKPKVDPRLLFVNGRTPRGHSYCASCCKPIDDGYVRDIASGLIYCNRRCSTKHSQRMTELASQLRSWIVS